MIAALATSVLVAVVWTGAIAVGIVLVLRGARGRIVDTASRCAACRYIIIEEPRRPDTCPECGASLSGPDRVRIGRRAIAPRPLAAGAAALALAASPLALLWPRGAPAPVAVAATAAAPVAPRVRSVAPIRAMLAPRPFTTVGAPARSDGRPAPAPPVPLAAPAPYAAALVAFDPPVDPVASFALRSPGRGDTRRGGDPLGELPPIDPRFIAFGAGAADPFTRARDPLPSAWGPWAAGLAAGSGSGRAADDRSGAVERVRGLRSERRRRSGRPLRSGAVERAGR